LRGKIPQLQKALEGNLTDHRFLLKLLWKDLAQQEELIAELAFLGCMVWGVLFR